MGTFLKSKGVYILIGFVVVIVAGISFFVYQKFQGTKAPQEAVQQPAQEPTQENAELSFSLEGTPTPAVSKPLSCIELTSTVSEKDQKTVTLTAKIKAVPQSTVSYLFTFEGSKEEYLDKKISTVDGQDTVTVTNTFSKPGTYDVELSLIDDNGNTSNTCKINITIVSEGIENPVPTTAIGGSNNPIALAPTGATTPTKSLTPTTTDTNTIALAPTGTITPTIVTKTPTPTKQALPTPTRKPSLIPTSTQGATTLSATPFPTTAEDESIPVPEVPTAGGVEPTFVAALGGSSIIFLALLLRKVAA